MERSEPDDGAWEDPLGMPGEPEYPPAPVPFHERRWRHPSEVGHAAWVQSERSAGLGRGLLVTSGAIGCILGLAVVWLMVPGPGSDPAAAPTVSRSDLALPTTVGAGIVAVTTTPVAATLTAVESSIAATLPSVAVTPAPEAPTTIVIPATVLPSVPTIQQLPAEDLPTNTVWLKSEAEGSESAVAVLVGNSPYLITTATAVGTEQTVRVVLASGGVTEIPVVSVDETFAYLLADDSLLTFGFAASAVPVEGESLTVLAEEQIVFTFGDETLATIDPASVAEGTPVVNENGALVGLCTGAEGTLAVVAIDTADPDVVPEAEPEPETSTADSIDEAPTTLPATTTTAPATTTSTTSPATTTTVTSSTTTTVVTTTTVPEARKPWMGVKLAGAQSPTPLVITAITAGSPAETAGLVAGERIIAIDGVAVATVEELVAQISPHAPGDTVVVAVSATGADGKTTDRQVSVVLGENSV